MSFRVHFQKTDERPDWADWLIGPNSSVADIEQVADKAAWKCPLKISVKDLRDHRYQIFARRLRTVHSMYRRDYGVFGHG